MHTQELVVVGWFPVPNNIVLAAPGLLHSMSLASCFSLQLTRCHLYTLSALWSLLFLSLAGSYFLSSLLWLASLSVVYFFNWLACLTLGIPPTLSCLLFLTVSSMWLGQNSLIWPKGDWGMSAWVTVGLSGEQQALVGKDNSVYSRKPRSICSPW